MRSTTNHIENNSLKRIKGLSHFIHDGILRSWNEPKLLISNFRLLFAAGLLIIGTSILLSSCEKDITINLPPSEEQFVVEGHIETGARLMCC
jgi:hypothetical protein